MLKQEFYQNPIEIRNENKTAIKKKQKEEQSDCDSQSFSIENFENDFNTKYLKHLYPKTVEKDGNTYYVYEEKDFNKIIENFETGVKEIKQKLTESAVDNKKTSREAAKCYLVASHYLLALHENSLFALKGSAVETSSKEKRQKILTYFLKQLSMGEKKYNSNFNSLESKLFDKIGQAYITDPEAISPFNILLGESASAFSRCILGKQFFTHKSYQKDNVEIDFGIDNKKIINTFINAICELSEAPKDFEISSYLIRIWELNKEYSSDSILKKIQTGKYKTPYPLVISLTNLIGAEEVRRKLNLLIEETKKQDNLKSVHPAQADTARLEKIRSIITPNHDKIAIENLQKFYQEKIKFEDYKINQKMNDSEVELLQGLISKDEKVLEEGCGTGRLLLKMKKAGYDAVGIDFTARHTEIIKKQNPESKVLQEDWHKTSFKNESFDTVYSLGRNILHDYSIIDQAQLFHEANRILKPSGKFIFDIPNRNKGGYKKMVDEYGNEMQKRGIRNFRQGTIYDSPDGINFATRYAYSEDDIKTLAQMTGFKIKEVRKKELATGQGDENLYFVLEKI